jgi:hypothetical protein
MLKQVRLPKHHNKLVTFVHRDQMRKQASQSKAYGTNLPPIVLPVDGTNNMGVSVPMDLNNSLGDCGEAMACHGDNIYTYMRGSGQESIFGLTAIQNQYLKVSGGDNGLDEDQVINQIWKVGIAGNTAAIIQDNLDVDITNVALAQSLIDNNLFICMAWSVPDDFLNDFATGIVFADADSPDPENGHFTPVADVGGPSSVASDGTNVNGFYRIITWGSWCWASPAFIKSVDPSCFVVFSSRQFNSSGLDCKGRHVSQQAQYWINIGGNAAIAAKVVAMFPPLPSPVPTPAPVPPPPKPAPLPSTFPKYSGTMQFSLNGTAVSGTVDLTPLT